MPQKKLAVCFDGKDGVQIVPGDQNTDHYYDLVEVLKIRESTRPTVFKSIPHESGIGTSFVLLWVSEKQSNASPVKRTIVAWTRRSIRDGSLLGPANYSLRKLSRDCLIFPTICA